MSGRHEAPWAVSGERELDAAPYIGRHRADPDPVWCDYHGRYHYALTNDCVLFRAQPDPDPARCPSCGHPYDAGCDCTCCYDNHDEVPDG